MNGGSTSANDESVNEFLLAKLPGFNRQLANEANGARVFRHAAPGAKLAAVRGVIKKISCIVYGLVWNVVLQDLVPTLDLVPTFA